MAESHILTQDGKARILSMIYSYIGGGENWDGIPSHCTVGTDVMAERTGQARWRQALGDACQAVQIANDVKTSFLLSVSHDIRMSMNAIINVAVITQVNL